MLVDRLLLYKSYVIYQLWFQGRGDEYQGLQEVEFIWRPTEKDFLIPKHITCIFVLVLPQGKRLCENAAASAKLEGMASIVNSLFLRTNTD